MERVFFKGCGLVFLAVGGIFLIDTVTGAAVCHNPDPCEQYGVTPLKYLPSAMQLFLNGVMTCVLIVVGCAALLGDPKEGRE